MSIPRVKPSFARFRRASCASVLIIASAVLPASAGQRGTKHVGKMEVSITAKPPLRATIEATCRTEDFQPDVTVIEGKSATLFMRFSLIEPKKGTHKIILEGLTSPDGPHARFDTLMIDKQGYSIPSGTVTLADDAARAGSIRATRFTTNGSRGVTATFTLDASWKCS